MKVHPLKINYNSQQQYFNENWPSIPKSILADTQNIKKRLSDKIIIFIDNAFEDYQDMDNIIVMKNASIVDHGNHDYLIKNCETYKSLINYSGGKSCTET